MDIEVIRMTATPDSHDGESFRVSQHRFHLGYARSVRELERWDRIRRTSRRH